MKRPVVGMKQATQFPLGLDILHDGAQVGDVFIQQGVIRLAHEAQLQALADLQHVGDGRVFIANGCEDHILEYKVKVKLLQHRAPPRLCRYHAHDFHGFDGFAQHIAADAQHLHQRLLGGQQIARL